MFQYRKRYEITCDLIVDSIISINHLMFQYRKRYEITWDLMRGLPGTGKSSFNTASGMRSHVTCKSDEERAESDAFQYRKRYEITCDQSRARRCRYQLLKFQYRKRYEITCDPCQDR